MRPRIAVSVLSTAVSTLFSSVPVRRLSTNALTLAMAPWVKVGSFLVPVQAFSRGRPNEAVVMRIDGAPHPKTAHTQIGEASS